MNVAIIDWWTPSGGFEYVLISAIVLLSRLSTECRSFSIRSSWSRRRFANASWRSSWWS
ncbi:hypothetical protein DPMN_081555 [Dreissena polymorpha]|uniref:Uncharacterized protein n=1 Tax=Dreissena polymorpha TaxID=45954 RepID=A0A9D4B9B6_DREPO|nr:hypothetical protein DPMN_081555 [Dreissena polymorpha]